MANTSGLVAILVGGTSLWEQVTHTAYKGTSPATSPSTVTNPCRPGQVEEVP